MKIADLTRKHARIGIDSNVVIYALEGSGPESEVARALFDRLAAGGCTGVLSILGVIEILVRPARHGDDALLHRYADELSELEGVEIVTIDRDAAIDAARVRASGVPLADAIHLATARASGSSAFLTNDRRLRTLPGMDMIALPDLVA